MFGPRFLCLLCAGCLVGLLAGCVTSGNGNDTNTAFPMLWDGKPGSTNWTAISFSAIDRHGPALYSTKPSDITAWCPAYLSQTKKERRAFWAYLMSALMRYESNYDPTKTYEENFTDSTGAKVISRGLLQLSIESANGYRCGIQDAKELYDPKTNLQCSVRIMNKWIGQDQVIAATNSAKKWRGLARYWSPFRRASQREAMQRKTRELPYCKS